MNRILNRKKGQAIFEYLFILSIAVLIALAMGRTILAGIDQTILTFGGTFEKALKTGRLAPDAWGN